jgi:hypothetical protein
MTLDQASEHAAEISRRAIAQMREERVEPLRQLGPQWARLIDQPLNRELNVCAADAKAAYRRLFGPHGDAAERERAIANALEMFGPQ